MSEQPSPTRARVDDDEHGDHTVLEDMEVLPVSKPDYLKLPPEMWVEVMKHVPKPQDHVNFMNSCDYFRNTMTSKRRLNLFSAVLPGMHGYLTESDLLSLRRVCKPWKKAVDDLLNAEPYQLELVQHKRVSNRQDYRNRGDDAEPHDGDYENLGVHLTTASQLERMIRFLEKKSKDGYYPLVGRRVTIGCTEFEKSQFWDRLQVYLKLAGCGIKYLHVRMCSQDILYSILRLTPNLEVLFFDNDDEEEDWEHHGIVNEGVPFLPKLYSLYANPRVGNSVVKPLYKLHANNLCHLNLNFGRIIESCMSSALNHISILKCRLTIRDLKTLARIPPPITELGIVVNQRRSKLDGVPVTLAFDYIQAFNDTLEFLEVCVETPDYSGLREYQMQLDKLKFLLLEEYAGPLDPFELCSRLENFVLITSSDPSEWNEESHVQFHLTNQGLTTNLWEIIPSLRKWTLELSWSHLGVQNYYPGPN